MRKRDFGAMIGLALMLTLFTGCGKEAECTQEQWEALMASHPSKFEGEHLPVEMVSWKEAQAFVSKLNEKVKPPTGWMWSLPTDAQWERACRAGTTTAWSFGDDKNELERKTKDPLRPSLRRMVQRLELTDQSWVSRPVLSSRSKALPPKKIVARGATSYSAAVDRAWRIIFLTPDLTRAGMPSHKPKPPVKISPRLSRRHRERSVGGETISR